MIEEYKAVTYSISCEHPSCDEAHETEVLLCEENLALFISRMKNQGWKITEKETCFTCDDAERLSALDDGAKNACCYHALCEFHGTLEDDLENSKKGEKIGGLDVICPLGHGRMVLDDRMSKWTDTYKCKKCGQKVDVKVTKEK